jgi:uncharacterized repeat protein (TIGR02543 family)
VDLPTTLAISSGATWELFSDENCQESLSQENGLELQDGENIFYVIVKSEDGLNTTKYTLRIFKRYDVTVTLDKNIDVAGTVSGGGEVEYGTSVTISATTNTGYTFDGWFKGNDIVSRNASYTFTAEEPELNLEARWIINRYTIRFDSNGGSGVEPITKLYGNTVEAPDNPVREGYTFSGWFSDDTLNNAYIFGEIGASDITVYAKWTASQHTVTVSKNIEEAGNISESVEKDYGASVTVTATTNPGYTFIGWYEGEDIVSEREDYTFVMGDVARNLQARWRINRYIIHFNSNGGSQVADITKNYGTEVTKPENPTREGYTFTNWYKEVGLQNIYEFSTMPAEDVTVYAGWDINAYTVTLSKNIETAGNIPESVEKNYGTSVTVNATTNEGYTFIGWYEGDDIVSERAEYSFIMGATGRNLKAKWVINRYTIHFNSNGGSQVADITKNYGTEVTKPENPTREGYTFTNWYKESELQNIYEFSTMPAEDVTVYAGWDINSYAVTLSKNLGEAGDINGGGDNIPYGSLVTITATTNDGYTFAGWYEGNAVVSVDLSYSFNMPANDRNLEAKWGSNPYYVDLNKNIEEAGTVLGEGNKNYATNVEVKATTNEGYTFLGWYENNQKVYELETYQFDMEARVRVLEARWEPKSYNVTLEKNIAVAGTVIGAGDKTYGSRVTVTATTNTGYTFTGWYEENVQVSDGSNPSYTFTMQASGRTFEARWSVNRYDVNLSQNIAGAGNVSGGGSNEYATQVVVKATTTNTGYTFIGWYENGQKIQDAGAEYGFIMPAYTRSLEARWEPRQFALTLTKNIEVAGTVSGGGNISYGSLAQITATTNTGYTFIGWYYKESGEVFSQDANYTFSMPANAIYLEARWNINQRTVTLTSNLEGAGELDGAGTYNYNSSVTIEATPNTGYTFDGWYENDTKISADEIFNFYMPDANKEYQARWLPYQRIDEDGTPNSNGAYILFGEWPQTYEPDTTKISQTETVTVGEFTYNLGIDGKTRYFKVDEAQPFPGPSTYFMDGTLIVAEQTYYFKVEPIKWRILNYNALVTHGTNKAFLLSEMLLEHKMFNTDTSNYELSLIRGWLINEFYNTAFITLQKQLIQLTNVDNSKASTGVADNPHANFGNTDDYIFLLSHLEAITPEYGFNSDYNFDDTARQKVIVDYARATGAHTMHISPWIGNSNWWLRSPSYDDEGRAQTVKYNGVFGAGFVHVPDYGVAPALWLSLSSTNQVVLSKHPNVAGTVTGGGDKYYGSQVTVTATSNPGYIWDGWYENGVKIEGAPLSYTFTMPSTTRILQAKWKIPLTLTNSLDTAGTITGDGEYNYNALVTAEANPKPGYTFAGWYNNDNLVSTEEHYLFNMPNASLTLEARWLSYQRLDGEGNPSKSGNFMLFGEWPQTIKADGVTIPGEGFEGTEGAPVPETTGPYAGYYAGYDTNDNLVGYYAQVTATPYESNYSFSFSNGTTIENGTIYYFKVEPIKWRILNHNSLTDDGDIAFILCESIIANMDYDIDEDAEGDNDTLSNNYKLSSTRKWLANQFYAKAFNSLRKELTEITLVDNSETSTGFSQNQYECEDTRDYVFLPSVKEVTNAAYGFVEDKNWLDPARERGITDYSKATGAYDGIEKGVWWLRSPANEGDEIQLLNIEDGFVWSVSANRTEVGVVPALRIALRQPDKYMLSLGKNYNIEGITVSGGGNKTAGELVTIKATTTNPGCVFDGWYKNNEKVENAPAEYTFSMPEDHIRYEARWTLNDYDLSLGKNFELAGIITGEGTYEYRSKVTVTATTNPGYTFDGWYNNAVKLSGEPEYTFKMPAGDMTYQARWLAYQRIDGDGTPNSDGEYILFGEYPQTLKAMGVTIPGEGFEGTQDGPVAESQGPYAGYYAGYDDSNNLVGYYEQVTASPYQSGYMFSDGTTEVLSGTIYYFKVEPVKWRILNYSSLATDEQAFLLCNSAITNRRWNEIFEGNPGGHYANNYEKSEIRAWLNGEFQATTFSPFRQALIQKATVDNSPDSTGDGSNPYTCANTEDDVFLISGSEANNYSLVDNASRIRVTTDYTRATGAMMITNQSGGRPYGRVNWWLRSPSRNNSKYVRLVDNGGNSSGVLSPVNDNSRGIVPALKLNLKQVYNLTLNKQYDEAGSVSGGGYKINNTETLITALTEHAGYYWDGWYENGVRVTTGTSYNVTISNCDRTLEARWTKRTFMLGLDMPCSATVGTISSSVELDCMGSAYVEYGTSITIGATTNPGFTFAGWYTWPASTIFSSNAQHTFNMPAYDLFLIARWTAPLTLTKESDEAGTVSGGGECLCNYVTTATAITKPGYTFDGWYNNGAKVSGDEVYSFYMPESSLTLEARWLGYQRIDQYGNSAPTDGTHILFGEWPQSLKDDSVTIPENAEPVAEGRYEGYYAGYIGDAFEGYYAKVNNYYFKVESIKWRILNYNTLTTTDGDVAFILCEDVIDNEPWDIDEDGSGPDTANNNYKLSAIRKWLNNEFYNKVFPSLQKELIERTWVDNSLASTGETSNPYVCEDTRDRIFLPSFSEMINTSFGFESNFSLEDTKRAKAPSSYAIEKGVGVRGTGNAWWFTRSPGKEGNDFVRAVKEGGPVTLKAGVGQTTYGIVPALRIALRTSGKYMLSLDSDSSVAGTVSGGGNKGGGDNVEIKAEPSPGYIFDGWYDNGEKIENAGATYSFTMPPAHTRYEARWKFAKYTLTLTNSMEDAGTVTGAGIYDYTQEVTITAEPNTGYQFVRWYNAQGGVPISTNPTYKFNMPIGNLHYVAVWKVQVTITQNMEGAGIIHGSGIEGPGTYYLTNGDIGIDAIANSGYAFDGWYIEGVKQDESYWGPGSYRGSTNVPITIEARWLPYRRITSGGVANENGDYILFGEWPQTEETNLDNVSPQTVSAGAGSEFDSYYLGTDGVTRYVKVGSKYFKVEPIKWRILNYNTLTTTDGDVAFILCESIIANMVYDTDEDGDGDLDTLSSKYDASQIRAWLNNQFYLTAFNTFRKELIEKTWVDNSEGSTGYSQNPNACDDTKDNIFLLSYVEATSDTYGLNNSDSRIKKVTDYSKETGAAYNSGSGNGVWWLRSPNRFINYYASGVDDFGDILDFDVYNTDFGVVPALKIALRRADKYMLSLGQDANLGKVYGGGNKDGGDEVAITAEPNPGYALDGWYEENGTEPVSTDNPYSFTMPNAHTRYEARWKFAEYTLTLNKNIDLAGTVEGAGIHEYTEVVTLRATTNPGYTFEGWYNNDTKLSEELEYPFSMPIGDTTIQARWFAYQRVDQYGNSSPTEGTHILFGVYPQTLKETGVTILGEGQEGTPDGPVAEADGPYKGYFAGYDLSNKLVGY